MTNTRDTSNGEIWFFTKQFGFRKPDDLTMGHLAQSDDHYGGDSFVAPRGTTSTASCPQS